MFVSFNRFVRITGIKNISNTIKFKTFFKHRLLGEKTFVKYVIEFTKIIRKCDYNVLGRRKKSSVVGASKVFECQGIN